MLCVSCANSLLMPCLQELATCDPNFYKHTQKIFLKLLEKGLAYQAEAEVNFDPVDKTVLANEQVDADGRSWRSGAKVEKRRMKQWFLRISALREDLLRDLDTLAEEEAWPERVLAMQRNWLGKSTGAMIKFPVMAFDHDMGAAIEVYTSRPETLPGVQYVALAATHPVVGDLAKNDPELQAFLDTIPGLPPDSKVGYLLPHLRAVNPLAYHENTPDETKKSIPVYVAAYVVGDYGEGAVMGVPAHDLRDHAFWREHHYEEPVRVVLAASETESSTAMLNEPFLSRGIMAEDSGPYKGMSSQDAGVMLVNMLEAAHLAKPVEKWRLRDWLISRQRYWGTPIPIIHCMACGAVPVPDEHLPVTLPDLDSHWATRKAGNPLEAPAGWTDVSCPKCGGAAQRDTDTMDTFVDSSWYYMRFVDPHNDAAPFDPEKAAARLPVDMYIGGVEHAILHLLYARFIYKVLMASSSASPPPAKPHEPFRRLITQGMVHGKTYSDPRTGRFLKPDEVDLGDATVPKVAATGEPAIVSFEKMSKSKHNGVDPTAFIAQHGADATRAHMLFQAPVSEVLLWDEEKIAGVTRWLGRVWDLVANVAEAGGESHGALRDYLERKAAEVDGMATHELAARDADVAIWRKVQETIASVAASYEKVYTLNTVVSDLMGLTNTIAANDAASVLVKREALSALVRMVAPVTPAFAEECWSVLCRPSPADSLQSIFQDASFPVPDGTLGLPALQPRTLKCAVQVNGKFRFAVEIPKAPDGLDGAELEAWARREILKTEVGSVKLGPALGGAGQLKGGAQKVIVVKRGELVNFLG